MTNIRKLELKKLILSTLLLPIYFHGDIQAQSKWQVHFGSSQFTRDIGGEDEVFRFGGDGMSEVRSLSVTYQKENNIWYKLSYEWGESGISTSFLFDGENVLPYRSGFQNQNDYIRIDSKVGTNSLTGYLGKFFNIHKSLSIIPSVGLAITSLNRGSRSYGANGSRIENGGLFDLIEGPSITHSRVVTPFLILANRFEFELLPNLAIFYDIGWRVSVFSEFQTLDQGFPGESGSTIEKRFGWNGTARMRSSGITWKFLGKKKKK